MRKKLVEDHAKAMLETLMLPKNSEKGSWEDIGTYDLLKLAEKEFEELSGALWQFMARTKPTKEHLQRVIDESSDVSNYLAMLVANCRRELEQSKHNGGTQ